MKNINMQEERYWSRFAHDFEERNTYVVGKSDMEIILNTLSREKELGATLELACGNGTYSRVLAKEATQLVATDYSENMINAAKNRLNAFKNVTLEKANCFDLKYSNHSFDTVFMANLLHIIPEPEKAVAESRRVLKPGGKIIIIELGMEGMALFNKMGMIYRYLKTYGKPPAKGTTLTTDIIQTLLVQNDFTIKTLELIGDKSKAAYVIGVTL